MQQRQLRLGDILDDYCPRERRVTNHAVVAMIGEDVKQTRCTTCDTEHEYKHAKVPRQRRKSETPAALYAQVAAGGPKRVSHESDVEGDSAGSNGADLAADALPPTAEQLAQEAGDGRSEPDAPQPQDDESSEVEEGPVHRPLIRATLPRQEGQPPPTRPAPDFTIRQPGGRQNRFRPRHGANPFRGGQRSNGGNVIGGPSRGDGMPRQGGGRVPVMPRLSKRHGPGRKRSK
jgi:hypothetical protein